MAPEPEVHHAGADVSAPDNTDLGISHTDAEQTKTKTPEKPEQEKEVPPSPKPATPPPRTASPPPPKQTMPQADPGGKKLTASDIGLQKRPRPSSSETSPAKKRLALSSSAQSAPTSGSGLDLQPHKTAADGSRNAAEAVRPGQISALTKSGGSLGSLENWAQDWNDADTETDEISSQMIRNPRPTPHPLGGYALCRQMLAVRKQMQAGEKMLNELSLNIEVNFSYCSDFAFEYLCKRHRHSLPQSPSFWWHMKYAS